eukprot:TRINITY_DN957_c0_g2_i1.p1 TRINITY_DN957_c0_g2~~TRINITY_DN957_c0_g2_i1.p1  ORF type:complete len:548 (-),score=91.60 TRINITY_DN957_c0_g2_i1:56-1699(-)
MSMITMLPPSFGALVSEVRSCASTMRDAVSSFLASVRLPMVLQKFRTSARRHRTLTVMMILASASACVLFLMYFGKDVSMPNACPAPAPRPKVDPGSASALLSKARVAEMEHDLDTAQALYRQCVQHAPVGRMTPTFADIRAQLECLADWNADARDISSVLNVFGARIAKNALDAARGVSRQCTTVHDKLNSFVRADMAPLRTGDAIVVLGGVAGLETSVREAFLSLRLLLLPKTKDLFGDNPTLSADVASTYDDLIKCALMSARQARLLSHSLPLANVAVRRVNQCKPNLLAGFESISLAESAEVSDPDIAFQRGLLMSEIICSPANTPFVGAKDDIRGWTADWSADSKGHKTPTQIVLSEQMMQAGLLSAKEDAVSAERSRVFASRLAVHAMVLTEMKQHSAAEWRYASSAMIATKRGPAEFASSSLGLLSHFYSLQGSTAEALEVAEKALSYSNDALSAYLHASLRLKVGLVVSDEQMYKVVEQLEAAHGKLPGENLEVERVRTLALLVKWRKISSVGQFSSCVVAGDVADVLTCLLGMFAFAS